MSPFPSLKRFKTDMETLAEAPEEGKATMILDMYKTINQWLKTGPLALATDAQGKIIAVNGGTHPWFEPKKEEGETAFNGPSTALQTFCDLA